MFGSHTDDDEPTDEEHNTGASDDQIFARDAAEVVTLAGRPWAPLMGEDYNPVQRVTDLLEMDDPSHEIAIHEEHVTKVREALEGFISRNYDSFNKSIEYFSEMIARVTTARDAIAAVKSKIRSAAALMLPRDGELADGRRRWAKTIVREHLLTEIQQCAKSERRATAALKAKNSLCTVRILKRYLTKIERLRSEELTVLEPVGALLRIKLNSVPNAALSFIFDAIFAPSALRAHAGDVEPVDLIPIISKADAEDFARYRFESSHAGGDQMVLSLATHVIAIKEIGESAVDQLAKAFADPNASAFREWVNTFVQRYVAGCANATLTQPSSSGASDLTVDASDAELGVAMRCTKQAQHFVVNALQGLLEVLRRAAFVLFTAASIEQPFFAVLLKDKLPFDSPRQWPLNDFYVDKTAIETIMRKATTSALAMVAQRGADQQSAMGRLAEVCTAVRLTNSFRIAQMNIVDLTRRINEERTHLLQVYATAVNADALRECCDILNGLVGDGIREHAFAVVSKCAARWTVRPFWLALQPYAIGIIDALTRITQYDSSAISLSVAAKAAAVPMSAIRVQPELDTLSALLYAKGSGGAPKYLEAIGLVTANDLVRAAKNIAAASGDAGSSGESKSATIKVDLGALKQLIPPSVYHTPAVLPVLIQFARVAISTFPSLELAPKTDLIKSTVGQFGNKSSFAFSAFVRQRWMSKLDQSISVQLSSRTDDTHHALSCASHVSSSQPILTLSLIVDRALTIMGPLRQLASEVSAEPTLKAADMLIEHLGVFLKSRLVAVAEGSFGLEAIRDMMDDAFSHRVTPIWEQLTETGRLGCRGAQTALDGAVSVQYKKISDSRASSRASHRNDEAGVTYDAAAKLLKSQTVVGEVAALSHSLEWIANRYIRFAHGGDPVDTSASIIPCKGVNIVGRHPTDAGVAVYQQISSIAQAALFALAGDIKLITCTHMADMRDFSYNLPSEGSQAHSYILRMVRTIRQIFAAAERHLGPAKRRYLAAAASTPASELFVHEVGHLRDKRITPAGAKQLALDILCVEHALLNLCPGDVELAQEVSTALRRTREYFSLLDANKPDVVREILALRLHEKFSPIELENLIAICNRGGAGDNKGFDKIEELRAKLGVLSNATFTIGAGALQGSVASTTGDLAPPVDVSLQALREFHQRRNEKRPPREKAPSPVKPKAVIPRPTPSIPISVLTKAVAPAATAVKLATPATPAAAAPSTGVTTPQRNPLAPPITPAKGDSPAAKPVETSKLPPVTAVPHPDDDEGEEEEGEYEDEEEEYDEEEEEEEEEVR